MENMTTQLNDVVFSNLSEYATLSDYNREDLLLKIIRRKENDALTPYKQPVSNFLEQHYFNLVGGNNLRILSFLDNVLVKNSDFIMKYVDWVRQLSKLQDKLADITDKMNKGVKLKLHDGMIIHSSLDDSEDKVIANYGGMKWKRILNFLRAKNNEVTSRGGEDYVTIPENTIPNHVHNLSITENNKGTPDVWKQSVNSNKIKYRNIKKYGAIWGSKQIYPELTPLNWSNDTETAYSTGGNRYVKPHNNIPPYDDVYIWECVDSRLPVARSSDSEVENILLDLFNASPKNNADLPLSDMMKEARSSIYDFSSISLPELTVKEKTIENLVDSLEFDAYEILLSDELLKHEEQRYESKQGTLGDLAQIETSLVYFDILGIQKRYLLKGVYSYLISDIQDRIYKLLVQLSGVNPSNVKIRVCLGQYIFIYQDPNSADDAATIFDNNYIVPAGMTKQKVNGLFLRGTSTYTEDTKNILKKYANVDGNVRTFSRGSEKVELVNENVPKHLHWSTILSGVNSVKIVKHDDEKGYDGTSMMKGDPISGGFMYAMKSGSGPYNFETQPSGYTSFSHTNMPSYGTLTVFKIVTSTQGA